LVTLIVLGKQKHKGLPGIREAKVQPRKNENQKNSNILKERSKAMKSVSQDREAGHSNEQKKKNTGHAKNLLQFRKTSNRSTPERIWGAHNQFICLGDQG